MKGTEPQQGPRSFAYRAQTAEGDRLDGRITAQSADAARWKLAAMGLRIIELSPTPPEGAQGAPSGARPLKSEDFAAFNQQLAQLTAAGLPIEQGLRLIAQDLGRGRLADAVRDVATDLESGMPLERAFGRHAGRFPPLYGRLVEAGVRTGNLSAVLLNVGRHAELTSRLRRTLWEAASYPIVVFAAMGMLLILLSWTIVPEYRAIMREFDTALPGPTQFVFNAADVAPWVIVAALIAIVATPQVWWVLVKAGRDRPIIDRLMRTMPLIGPVLRRNMAARWCDAARIGVEAGLDLPSAMRLSDDLIALPSVHADTEAMIAAVSRGQPAQDAEPLAVVPPLVAVSLDLATERGDVGPTLDRLAAMYGKQAEYRLGFLSSVFGPILVIVTAIVMGFTVLALMLPLVSVIQSVSK